ncbi:MAG: 5-(carboxyamino)imidazole ribonucleotide mutase, partial [Actinobacteria bacterium]|nr:5-(carboxyamino)imidazole ribonucleotide mutase [Actinomycetota bacterium]
IGNAKNAGLLAARILSISDVSLQATLTKYAGDLHDEALAKGAALKARRENKTGF